MTYLCFNKNKNAINLLHKNQDNIYWIFISQNPSAISLLEQNQTHIRWEYLCRNPSIFKRDYQSMSSDRNKIIYQELMEKSLHPSRILNWMEEDYD
jgi:hypothetical protein